MYEIEEPSPQPGQWANPRFFRMQNEKWVELFGLVIARYRRPKLQNRSSSGTFD
jgi:hypothetical protein